MNVQSHNVLLELVEGPQPGAVGVELGPAGLGIVLPQDVQVQLEQAGYGEDNPDLWVLATPASACDPNGPRNPLLRIEITLSTETLAELNALMGTQDAGTVRPC